MKEKNNHRTENKNTPLKAVALGLLTLPKCIIKYCHCVTRSRFTLVCRVLKQMYSGKNSNDNCTHYNNNHHRRDDDHICITRSWFIRVTSYILSLLLLPQLLSLLLFHSIWNHLVQITKDGNKTVIITTHYIEEARQAHTVIRW